MSSKRQKEKKLIGPWKAVHTAVWLVGLAVLFWKGWWWPGILVLVAITVLLDALIEMVAPEALVEEARHDEPVPAPPLVTNAAAVVPNPAAAVPVETLKPVEPQHRLELLPSECPKCGAPVHGNDVNWTGPQSADCPYCGANLPMRQS